MDFIVLLKIAKKYERNYEFLGFDSDFECQLIKIYELNQVMFFEIRTPTQVNNSDLLSSSQNTIKSVRSSDININISNILLDIDDFLDVFSLVQVSKIHKDYFYITTQITHIPNAYSIRSFELTHPGHCYIELSQLDKRYFRNLGSYNYIFSRLILAKRLNYYDDEFLGRSSFVYIDGVAERERNSHLDLYLDKGVYYIIVCLDYENRIYDACLSFYGEEKVELDRENFKNNEGVFEEIMKEIVSKYGRKIEIRPGLYISHYISVKDCLLIEFFSNETKDNSYEIKRRTSSKGLRRIGEKKTMEYYEFKLIGVEERTFLFKYQDGKEIGEVYRELNEDCEKDLEVNLIKDIRLE